MVAVLGKLVERCFRRWIVLLHVRPRRSCEAGVDGGIRVPLMKGLETWVKTGWFSSILWGHFDMEVGRKGGVPLWVGGSRTSCFFGQMLFLFMTIHRRSEGFCWWNWMRYRRLLDDWWFGGFKHGSTAMLVSQIGQPHHLLARKLAPFRLVEL